jgi:hypothetical protein
MSVRGPPATYRFSHKEQTMSEQNQTPIVDDVELSEQELEGVAGGDTNNGCTITNNGCSPQVELPNG